ncbi:MAG: subclass B1 metallo-beta-lactamase [Sedimentisphaerales bacterium]|nr:subclass B1 metallo-beta-lactamase [Sedimentisphaerales bacterium]
MQIETKAACVRTFKILLFICVVISVVISAHGESSDSGIRLSDDVVVERLAEGVWLHTSYYDISGYQNVPANGLIVIDEKEAIMVDLPWTDEQTAVLFKWINDEQNAKVKSVVPTHFHIDCAGGLAEAHRRKAESFALDKTVEILKRTDKAAPKNWFSERLCLGCGSFHVELSYYGAGHTVDNIVAWIPEKKIFFGGCMVKSMRANNLGNIEDADLDEWPGTLKKIKEKYSDAEIVVPGHGRPGGTELIDHTIGLFKR